jgi:hypothetical protein
MLVWSHALSRVVGLSPSRTQKDSRSVSEIPAATSISSFSQVTRDDSGASTGQVT